MTEKEKPHLDADVETIAELARNAEDKDLEQALQTLSIYLHDNRLSLEALELLADSLHYSVERYKLDLAIKRRCGIDTTADYTEIDTGIVYQPIEFIENKLRNTLYLLYKDLEGNKYVCSCESFSKNFKRYAERSVLFS